MEPQPEKKFRGTWIPAKLFDIFENGKISAGDLVLLAFVDAFSDEVKGCFASNKFLAGKLRMTPESVGNSVSRLVRLGLLKRTVTRIKFRTRRNLWVILEPTPLSNGVSNPLSNGVCPFPTERYLKQSTGSVAMPLFDHLVVKGPDELHLTWARCLIVTLKTHRRSTGPTSATKWANHFNLLAKDLCGDKERIHRVLEWFTNHVTDQYTPRVYSARTFRSKFIPIEDAMKRQNPAAEIVVGYRAKRIAARLKSKSWPKGTAVSVPAVAQISLDAYAVFRKRLFEFSETVNALPLRNKQRKAIGGLLSHLDHALPSTAHFVEQWLTTTQQQIDGWVDWSGDLFAMAFDIKTERFRSMGRGMANSYCNDPNRWDLMMEQMNES